MGESELIRKWRENRIKRAKYYVEFLDVGGPSQSDHIQRFHTSDFPSEQAIMDVKRILISAFFFVLLISASLVVSRAHYHHHQQQQTEGQLVKILRRSRRSFGYRTKCIDQVKNYCKSFTVGGMTKLFCVAKVVPHCTALDKWSDWSHPLRMGDGV